MILGSSSAFQVFSPFQVHALTGKKSTLVRLSEATVSDVEIVESTKNLKQNLLDTATRIKSEYGVLVIDKAAQDELKAAVKELEDSASDDGDGDETYEVPYTPEQLVGNWTLLCSTASADLSNLSQGKMKKTNGFAFDTSKLPFVKDIRTLLNKSLEVQQRILKNSNDTSTTDSFNRIEHVLQYKPPNKLEEFLNDVPDALKSLDLNPLQVSAGKVVLVHKAEVESVIPVLKTKLSLSSVVVNIAGKSQILEPDGADVLGINVPLGEFLNAGSFETTYMDEDLRISRSKVGIIDQLRVFVRSESMAPNAEDEGTAMMREDAEIVDMNTRVIDDESETGNAPDDDISPSDVE
jgi:hypothetical protein